MKQNEIEETIKKLKDHDENVVTIKVMMIGNQRVEVKQYPMVKDNPSHFVNRCAIRGHVVQIVPKEETPITIL
jgi:hypothetical protein